MLTSVKPKERTDIMNAVPESELKVHQEKIGGKRVTLDALKEGMMKEAY